MRIIRDWWDLFTYLMVRWEKEKHAVTEPVNSFLRNYVTMKVTIFTQSGEVTSFKATKYLNTCYLYCWLVSYLCQIGQALLMTFALKDIDQIKGVSCA